MVVGLVGSGNMATALARGWGEPVLCTDVFEDRAQALAAATGGEAVGSNAELAERADVVMLCHKPHQLEQVAEQIGGRAKAIASILASVTVSRLEAAYPDTPVMRLMPNTAVEVRRGVICYAPGTRLPEALQSELLELLGRSGRVVPVEDRLIDVAMALISVAPAYVALIAEAWVDAVVARGMPADQASAMIGDAIAGSADLLIANDTDTLRTRRAVTTPGGVTAQGLDALERSGIRAAFRDAVDAVVDHTP
jgi:pyrroline-5-carboxylate reductase